MFCLTSNKSSTVRDLVFTAMLHTMISGPIATDGVSSGCGWRRQPPDMEGSCEYIDSRQGVVLQLEVWMKG
jgi:hypothetical protein